MIDFNLIVARTKNNIIGDEDGNLIFKIPNDLKHFKSTTINQVVIMGRKTYESIGKPLQNRVNIIITRNQEYLKDSIDENLIVINNYNDLFSYLNNNHIDKEKFIIGGGEIYKFFIENNMINKYYITEIDADYLGDGIKIIDPFLDEYNKSFILNDKYHDIDYSIVKYYK